MYRVAILTISDSGAAGLRPDQSGPVIEEIVTQGGYQVVKNHILPDEQAEIEAVLCTIADENLADLVLTTGGTGFSPRDWTPEATLAVSHRLVPGIPEAMRAFSLQITPRAMLSRATAGIRHQTLMINLPGSPKAVRECLEYILPSLDHGLEILTGQGSNCART